MPDFSKKNTKPAGGKYADRDLTFSESTWSEIASPSGFVGIYFVSNLLGDDDAPVDPERPKRWLLGDAEKLTNRVRVEDGKLVDVDSDKPYVPRDNDETSWLFNSLEDAGVPTKVLTKIGSNPGGIDGYTAHMIEKPTGRKQKKEGVETKYDQTILVAESIVSEPKGASKSTSAARPAATTTGKKATKPAPEPEPDENEEESGESSGEDNLHAACVATIQNILAEPKKFIPTFLKKQHNGGVKLAQMGNGALANGVPKEYRELDGVNKTVVSSTLRKPAIYEQYDGELWSFDADTGVVTAIAE